MAWLLCVGRPPPPAPPSLRVWTGGGADKTGPYIGLRRSNGCVTIGLTDGVGFAEAEDEPGGIAAAERRPRGGLQLVRRGADRGGGVRQSGGGGDPRRE